MRRFARLATHLLILTLFFAGHASAQNVLTPGHVARLRLVSQAAINPVGTEVAYVLAVPRMPFQEDDGPSWTELHVVVADGPGDHREATDGLAVVRTLDRLTTSLHSGAPA